MRKFKTAAKNRTNYVYYTAEGKPIVITPGMVGEDGKAVTESLMVAGFLEPAVFNKENNALVVEEQQLRQEKEQLMNSVGGDKVKIKELQKLMTFTAKGEMLTAFSDEMFLAFVDSITVETRERIVFHLKCGLNLTERLVM